jgi:hypothetical protein
MASLWTDNALPPLRLQIEFLAFEQAGLPVIRRA